MAKILLVGSRADITHFVTVQLLQEGWEVFPAVGPEEGLRQLEGLDDVDAMIIGGPAAWASREELSAALKRRHPYALVVYPTSPDTIGSQLHAAFGDTAN